MARTIRNVVTETVQTSKPEGKYVYNKFLQITERSATDIKPHRLVIVGTEEVTPYHAGTPELLLKRLEALSEETGLPIDQWSVRYPEEGEPRMDKPALRFNKYGPYLSFFPAREKTQTIRKASTKRVWR